MSRSKHLVWEGKSSAKGEEEERGEGTAGREGIEKQQPRRNQSLNERSRSCFEDLRLQGKHLPTRIFLRLPVQSYLDRKSNPAIILVLPLCLPDLLLVHPLL